MENEFEHFQSGKNSYFDIVRVILSLVNIDLTSFDTLKDMCIQKICGELKAKLEALCISSLQDFSKLHLYASVKHHFGKEKYLDLVSNPCARRAISCIRLSVHTFDIEIGRRTNIPKDQRFCSKCQSREVGDEFHTLFRCQNPNLVDIRQKAIFEIGRVVESFHALSEKDKFNYCLLACDENICHIIGFFFLKVLKNC